LVNVEAGGDEPNIGPGDTSTLEGELHLAIARRVREYRQELGLTVGQLADESGISKGMLSKIENAQASPSLATLARLSAAVGVPVTSFFRGLEEEHDAFFVPAGEGLDIVRKGTRHGHRYQLLGSNRGSAKRMEPTFVTLTERSEVFPLFQHRGTELIYMLQGRVVYGYGSARYELKQGDSLQFDGEVPHGPVELNRLPIRFLSIISYGQLPDSN
jgi:transcriptional regulator with XRE-family HTH domain